MKTNQINTEELTIEEKIKVWEKFYGEIRVINVGQEVEEVFNPKTKKTEERIIKEGKKGYLRKPDRATVKYAMSKSVRADQSIDTISPGEIILKKCWLGGAEELHDDDFYFYRACMEANTYLNEIMGFL